MSVASTSTSRIPVYGVRFCAPVALAASAGEGLRRFAGVAYGGGTITDHGWWDAVAFDLAGLRAAAPMPLLLQHDHDRQIGVIDEVSNTGSELSVAGRLFTGIDPAADEVAAKADAGAPWQLSVGIYPDRIEQLPADGQGAVVNGRQVRPGASVFRSARVREASFVALGADSTTYANVFDSGGEYVAQVITQENHMSDANAAAELAARAAERDAEKARADAAEAKLAELQEQFSARTKAEREAAVKVLLGDAFSAEAAAPYMDMTPAQFAAAESLARTLRASRLPPGFTSEQAGHGRSAAAGTITPEGVQKYRRENPGATYEQAFAALKTTAT